MVDTHSPGPWSDTARSRYQRRRPLRKELSTMNDTTLSTALHVLGHWPGARVLPVNGKVPVFSEVPRGSTDATDDPKQATAWFVGTTYGVAVTGILAIDCDRLDMLDAPESIETGVTIQGNPERVTYLFAQPTQPFGDGAHAAGEVKGSGYVVLPPSHHDGGDDCALCADGGTHDYVWFGAELNGLPPCPPDLEAWVAARVRRQTDHQHPADEVPPLWLTLGTPCRTVVRQVDEFTVELADPRVAKHEVTRDVVLRLLRLGEQGHAGVGEAMGTVYARFLTACQERRPDKGRSAPHEFYRLAVGAVPAIEANPTPGEDYGCCGTDNPEWEDIWNTPGPLKRIADWADATSTGRWAVLGSTLAQVVTEVPPSIRIPAFIGSPASLNLYVALVGPSGSGKSAAFEVARSATLTPYRRLEGAGTGEGLITAFMTKTSKEDREAAAQAGRTLPNLTLRPDPHVLAYIDEVAQWQAVAARGSTFDSILRSMWTGSAVATTNADPDSRRYLPSQEYRLALVVGVQPELAGSMLDSTALATGTAQRWLWFPTSNPNVPDDDAPVPETPPGEVWHAPTYPPGGGFIEFPTYVRAEVVALHRRKQRTGSTEDAIQAHAMLARLKVAGALALLHGTLEVDDAIWTLSGVVMDKSQAEVGKVLHTLAGKAEAEAEARGRGDAARERGRQVAIGERLDRIIAVLARKVRHHVLTGEHESCPKRCLHHAIGRDRPLLDDAIIQALDIGALVEEDGRYRPGPWAPA